MKCLPHDYEAEKGLIGSLLIDFHRVYGLCANKNINSEYFHHPRNKLIYEALVYMAKKMIPVDMLLVAKTMKDNATLETAGGFLYLEECIDQTPVAAHAEYYLEIVINHFLEREWLVVSRFIQDNIGELPLEDISSYVIAADKRISSSQAADQLTTEGAEQIATRLQKRLKIKAPVIQKIPSSINTLRERIRGYPIGRMTVIASRPGVGKTSMATSESIPMAEAGYRVAVWTGEMSSDEYMARMACIHADVNTEEYFDGNLDDDDLDKLEASLNYIKSLPIVINDRGMNINGIIRWMEKLRGKVDVIIIDHFLLIKMISKRGQNNAAIYGQWSRSISAAAKENNQAVLLLAQIKRLYTYQGIKAPPSKDDLKETGCLEEDAYLILIVHNEPIKRDDIMVSNYQLIVDKHRNGWSGTCPVNFNKKCAHITGIKP